jgi:rhomboid protease GluP
MGGKIKSMQQTKNQERLVLAGRGGFPLQRTMRSRQALLRPAPRAPQRASFRAPLRPPPRPNKKADQQLPEEGSPVAAPESALAAPAFPPVGQPRDKQLADEPRASHAPWPDLAPLVDGRPAGRLSQQQTKLWSLVLRARRVPHRVRALPGGYTVQVPPRFTRQAVEEILLYQQENVSPHPSIPLPPAGERTRPTVAAMLALCAFFALTHRAWPVLGWYPQYWHAVGVADASGILHGQLWRVLTALTLHADPAHIASNAVVGGAFLILLARRVGSGTAWLTAVLAGALGNLMNALVYAVLDGPGHLSIGFSTAVFGAAGVLAGLKALSGEGDFRVKAHSAGQGWLLPVAAALALLATLGTAGENTDIGAHFFGLFSGLLLGGALGLRARQRGRPDEWAEGRFNAAAGALTGLLLAGAWACGWTFGWPAPPL